MTRFSNMVLLIANKKKQERNNNNFFLQVSIFCEVTVKRISDPNNWFFKKCSSCDLELELEDGKFKCSRANGCGRIIPYPDKR